MKRILALPLLCCGFAGWTQVHHWELGSSLRLPGLKMASVRSGENPSPVVRRLALSTGVTLEYAEQGDPNGVPVIFLHGITDSWHSFEAMMKHLPPNIHAFALSQRGHGNSDRPRRGYSPLNFAADVAAFVQQKELGAVVIVGHSMGGMHAQQFAVSYPKLTRALVIASSDAYFLDNKGMPEFYQEVIQLKGEMPYDFMVGFQRASIARPIDSAYFNLLVAESMKVPVHVFQDALTGLMQTDLRQQLPRIKCPTLIMWGEQDGLFTRSDQDLFLRQIPNVQLVSYKESGHTPHWEEPMLFAQDLLRFINAQQTSSL